MCLVAWMVFRRRTSCILAAEKQAKQVQILKNKVFGEVAWADTKKYYRCLVACTSGCNLLRMWDLRGTLTLLLHPPGLAGQGCSKRAHLWSLHPTVDLLLPMQNTVAEAGNKSCFSARIYACTGACITGAMNQTRPYLSSGWGSSIWVMETLTVAAESSIWAVGKSIPAFSSLLCQVCGRHQEAITRTRKQRAWRRKTICERPCWAKVPNMAEVYMLLLTLDAYCWLYWWICVKEEGISTENQHIWCLHGTPSIHQCKVYFE